MELFFKESSWEINPPELFFFRNVSKNEAS